MYIGVDIGGTKIRAGLIDKKIQVLKVIERPTEADKNRKAVLENIFSVIRELDSSAVKGIGMATRGLVDHEAGVVREVDKMPKDFPGVRLVAEVKKRFKKPTYLDNDVNSFTLAEGLFGAGKDASIVVGLTLGTGIGGGILFKDEVFRGARGGAAEFGKTVIAAEWYRKSKGTWGTFESLVSGTAMDNLYALHTGKHVGSKEVEFSMYRGNKTAKKVINDMSHYLAVGLANIIQSINPDMIIMGGGVGKVRALVDPAIALISRYLVYKEHAKTEVTYAELGPHAGLMGAALLCQERKNK